MKRGLVLALCTVLVAPVAVAYDFEVVEVRMMPTPQGWADMPNSPQGDIQPSPTGEANICCLFDETPCENYPGPYEVGNTLALNTYWNETLDGTAGLWEVSWTLGISVPQVVILFENEVVSFGDLTGLEGDFTFCVAGLLTLPPQAEGVTINAGHGVTSPGGTLAPGLNGSTCTVDSQNSPLGDCFGDRGCVGLPLFTNITRHACDDGRIPGFVGSWRDDATGECFNC